MSELLAKNYLKKYNMDNLIITKNTSLATVKEAAESLNCEEGRIAKTLSFKTEKGVHIIVMAGDVKIDNNKYKQYFHEKAHMLEYDEVESLIGHSVGGVCPFGIKENVKIYLDESLKEYKTVYPACGESNNAIEITPEKLDEILNVTSWIDVCKKKENN